MEMMRIKMKWNRIKVKGSRQKSAELRGISYLWDWLSLDFYMAAQQFQSGNGDVNGFISSDFFYASYINQ